MTGVPDEAADLPQVAVPAAGIDTRAVAIGGETAKTLEALRNHSQFYALRQLVQSNPAALPSVLHRIGAQSTELLRLINQNQDRFVQMLNEPIGTLGVVSASSTACAAPNLPPGEMEHMMASISGGGLESLDGGARSGTWTAGHALCYLKKKQQQSIGCFERLDVIQAYMACDKNEALASNFLMDSGDSFGGGAAGSAAVEQGEDNDDIYG
ncbi:hypothetical protein PsorP6_012234 [Peronosclerospora sorghi]|uniref:Uncharacterized protein n=1 Tax=Peronosclerospora sorghi TaxID=230839 RepID=A0ACC0WJJ5_9STRA|nr:hypothetical protein PsorP6_012234 [Peronosclerospora sorghi]